MDAAPIDVYELCRDVRRQGVQFPMLLRFPEIVRGRLHELQVSRLSICCLKKNCSCSVQHLSINVDGSWCPDKDALSAGIVQLCNRACWLSGNTLSNIILHQATPAILCSCSLQALRRGPPGCYGAHIASISCHLSHGHTLLCVRTNRLGHTMIGVWGLSKWVVAGCLLWRVSSKVQP